MVSEKEGVDLNDVAMEEAVLVDCNADAPSDEASSDMDIDENFQRSPRVSDEDCHDLSLVDDLTEEYLIRILRARYFIDRIYTWTGDI